MPKSFFSLLLLLFGALNSHSQSPNYYKFSEIPTELLMAANAVVRYESTTLEIEDFDDVVLRQKRIVTILSKNGQVDMGTRVFYDENRKIKTLEARIFDKSGKEIKKFKKNDFEDVSAVEGGTLYSDNRVKYLRYTPIRYPYTLEFELEVELSSTAFLMPWFPLEGFHCSTEYSEYKIVNNSAIEIKSKELNLENYNIEKLGNVHFKAENLKAVRWEEYSPSYHEFLPMVKVALTDFNMEGVRGVNNNWKDFGKWMYDHLLTGTDELPQSVKTEIRSLTEHLNDPMEKAKVVYEYVQNKTRYISVQVGIGGWKPIHATDVDRLGYGDCKGLTNYTKALLESVGVKSNYAVIYGGHDIRNIDNSFSLTEGDHAVLNVPTEEENVWLECTSKTAPFGFVAGFTDDREALIITEDGGQIVHTTAYGANDNLQKTVADIELNEDGMLNAELQIESYGYQYARKSGIQNLKRNEQELKIKENWSHINNLNLEDFNLNDDRNNVVFSEDLKLSASNFANSAGDYLIFQINPFTVLKNLPSRYSNRKLDVEIDRSQMERDEFTFSLPKGAKIDAVPENEEINSKFGTYSFSVELLDENKLRYTRNFTINKGKYSNKDYEDFREFMTEVYKHDNSKVAIITNKN